ncbi:ribosome assembly protein [Schizosaccharomyces cryophilus OY26]|uniref:Ribosome assembly protein n=1 Tax=Schizosaccharomyces cryophilus (strain OY26 / ATCC MYA-4695 / CBS 11777 / NBRC 106824 / NRRL Y48691) TaxID=653667 RepID=S9XFT7_SCHCR|nr:ribosome assembly protein [Schizosaccharomyces cryophilus OY26]EPY52501.1 ribosome assembly protein [Schizosaccharomyces cryophilus OY26]
MEQQKEFIYDKPPPPPGSVHSSGNSSDLSSGNVGDGVNQTRKRNHPSANSRPPKRARGGRNFRGGFSHGQRGGGENIVDGIEYLRKRNISLNTPEEIESWIHERKKNWPTNKNVTLKKEKTINENKDKQNAKDGSQASTPNEPVKRQVSYSSKLPFSAQKKQNLYSKLVNNQVEQENIFLLQFFKALTEQSTTPL